MKILPLTILLAVLAVAGCSHDGAVQADCIDTVLEQKNMVRYNGQEIGCKYFLQLYQYKNQQFFLYGNNCADMVSYPFDCEGNILCNDDENSECKKFRKRAKRIGIIGVAR